MIQHKQLLDSKTPFEFLLQNTNFVHRLLHMFWHHIIISHGQHFHLKGPIVHVWHMLAVTETGIQINTVVWGKWRSICASMSGSVDACCFLGDGFLLQTSSYVFYWPNVYAYKSSILNNKTCYMELSLSSQHNIQCFALSQQIWILYLKHWFNFSQGYATPVMRH